MKKIIIVKILAIFIIGMVGGIFAEQIVWPFLVEKQIFAKYGIDDTSGKNITQIKEVTISENSAITDAVAKVEKSVVGVTVNTKEDIKKGSGLIISSDGLIVTLADLVPQDYDPQLFINGQPVDFQVLKRDATQNLALIKVDENSLPTVSFGDVSKLKLGQSVFLVGTAYEVKNFGYAANSGVISYIDPDTIETNILETANMQGSILFDTTGQVLGINTVDYWGRVSPIPADKIKTFAGF